jgi:spore coat polysaccharide biosynthesis protein SpsF (cytidylyltransferase family)/aryl-alcohol dehydrogenase-like predicted oxidoreductase
VIDRPLLVVIQSRLASSRLPAKALLPLGGVASVVLCARRAANTGLPVVVATSIARDDDAIASQLALANVACFRGPHEDVLARFAGVAASMPAEGIVVRLTADNLFPDGFFVEAIVAAFVSADLDHLGTDSPHDGLPYGLSAEVISVAALRRAHGEASAAADREHVTPWIRRHLRSGRFDIASREPHWSRLRCTLDTFEDYASLMRVFAEVDPVAAPWRMLVDRLSEIDPRGREERCHFRIGHDGRYRSVLTLGTAQWGLPYGISNRSGIPGDTELAGLLCDAGDAGITSIDTAREYGVAEARIGASLPSSRRDRFEITTKLGVLSDVPADASPAAVTNAVNASVFQSLHALRCRRIDTLLLHRWAHRHAWRGAAWSALLSLQEQGLIGRLGGSVTTPAEAVDALEDAAVEQVQCPVNVLDRRWQAKGFQAALARRPDVAVHARSALLQGLLTLPAVRWPTVPGVDASHLCDLLDSLVTRLVRVDRVDLCLAYVRSLPWVGTVVVGMESRRQLDLNLIAARSPALSTGELAMIDRHIPSLPETLLDPSRWEKLDA